MKPRPADFADAHRRYLEDAELLFENARWATADHLYGLSAECGLKAIMLRLGMDVDDVSGAPREREHRQHLPKFWRVFENFAGKHDGARYVGMLSAHRRFDDWSINDRYTHGCNFQDENVRPHSDAARGVSEVVREATQELMT